MEAKPGVFIDSLTSADRKGVAVARGLFAYFPDALALVARHSVRSNEKHNPGQPVHWSREKSTDHEDCIARHAISIAIDPDSLDDGQLHMVCRAWRALAALQLWAEAQHAKPAVEWKDWKGGEEPPVNRAVPVQVRLRDGEVIPTVGPNGETRYQAARHYRWTHIKGAAGAFDIVAYRVHPGI